MGKCEFLFLFFNIDNQSIRELLQQHTYIYDFPTFKNQF
jgi:hypothetical protein